MTPLGGVLMSFDTATRRELDRSTAPPTPLRFGISRPNLRPSSDRRDTVRLPSRESNPYFLVILLALVALGRERRAEGMRRRGCWEAGRRSDSLECCPDASEPAQPSWGTRSRLRFTARSAAKVDLVGAPGERRSGTVHRDPPPSREATTSYRPAAKTGGTSSANMATVIRSADSPLGPRTNKMVDCCFRRPHEAYVVLPALGVDALIASRRPWRLALHARSPFNTSLTRVLQARATRIGHLQLDERTSPTSEC